MLKSSRCLNYSIFMFVAAHGLAACAPSANDTVALVHAGDGRACSTLEVKGRLQQELTSFLSYRALKSELEGQSLERFGLVFDPIISTTADPGVVNCAASAYLSLDGDRPFASNQIQFEYSLAANRNRKSEFVLRGAFADAKEHARLLYENSGVLQETGSAPSGADSNQVPVPNGSKTRANWIQKGLDLGKASTDPRSGCRLFERSGETWLSFYLPRSHGGDFVITRPNGDFMFIAFSLGTATSDPNPPVVPAPLFRSYTGQVTIPVKDVEGVNWRVGGGRERIFSAPGEYELKVSDALETDEPKLDVYCPLRYVR